VIIHRYLIHELLKPLLVVLAVLVTIFAAYSTSHYLADAMDGLVSVTTTMKLVLLRVVISLEVLVPTSLYVSIVVGLGRLHKNGEMLALAAAGVGPGRILKVVLFLSLPFVLLAAVLSLFIRPLSYEQTFWLKARAEADLDLTRLKPGKFYELSEGDRFLFIEEVDHSRKKALGVFLLNDHEEDGGLLELMVAQEAFHYLDPASGQRSILFVDGFYCEFPRVGTWSGKMIRSPRYTLSLWPKQITPAEHKVKAVSTLQLARSGQLSDIAELQWRLSAPISTLLLAILAVPLSRSRPREGHYGAASLAAVVYAIFFRLSTMGKLLVEQGLVPPMPGMWWVHGLLGTLAVVLYHPFHHFRLPRGNQ